jgi:4'-phosphopantetheinyl transferase
VTSRADIRLAGVQVWLRRTAGGRGEAAALAVHAAADLLGTDGGGLTVEHDEAGRPLLAHGPAAHPCVRLSVSRSRGVSAAAVTAAGPVGVDVEVIRPLEVLALARRWFPGSEAAWLAGLPASQRPEAFLGLWTQKEAIAKARGTGLRGGAGLAQPVRLLADLPRLAGPWQAPVTAVMGAGPVRLGNAVLLGEAVLLGDAVPGGAVLAVAVARIDDQAILAVACISPDPPGAPVWLRSAGAGR